MYSLFVLTCCTWGKNKHFSSCLYDLRILWARGLFWNLNFGERWPLSHWQGLQIFFSVKMMWNLLWLQDALEWAIKQNLWGHALFLASKMDPKTHASIMTRWGSGNLWKVEITINKRHVAFFSLLKNVLYFIWQFNCIEAEFLDLSYMCCYFPYPGLPMYPWRSMTLYRPCIN